MKIVRIMGGLADQLNQYMFARYIDLTSDDNAEPCFLDDSNYYLSPRIKGKRRGETIYPCYNWDHFPEENGDNEMHNGLELREVFPNIKLNLLSEQFPVKQWEEMMEKAFDGMSMIKILSSVYEKDFQLVQGLYCYTDAVITTMGKFMPEITRREGDIYYLGHWGAGIWENVDDSVRPDEFLFTPFIDEKNLAYQHEIETTTSVSIHNRRTGFADCNGMVSLVYFADAVSFIKSKVDHPVFFIFSDDLEYSKQNYLEMGLTREDKIFYIEGNDTGGKNHIDMQLMSMCKHMILCKSSFSMRARYFNKNKNKIIVSP